MKIAFLIHSLGAGGAERVTANLANHWEKLGYEMTIVTFSSIDKDFYSVSNNVSRISIDGARKSSSLIKRVFYSFGNLLKIRKFLKNERPDVVISMMTTSNIYLSISATGLKYIKTIGSERSNPAKDNNRTLKSFFIRNYSYRKLDAVIALTSQTKEWIERNAKARNVHVIPNSVVYPLPRFEPIVTPPNKRERYVLLAAGRLVEEKGYKALIKAFSLISAKQNKWDLHILSDGPLRTELFDYVRDLKQDGRVLFHGSVGNIADWYEIADIYILTSKKEGFPNTLAEAISYGVPAISFDCETGPRDIIEDGINGILIEDGNIEQLTLELEKLMSDESLRNKFSENSISIRMKYSPSSISDNWITLFNNLTS